MLDLDGIIFNGIRFPPEGLQDVLPTADRKKHISGIYGEIFEQSGWRILPLLVFYTGHPQTFANRCYLFGLRNRPEKKEDEISDLAIVGIHQSTKVLVILLRYREEILTNVLSWLDHATKFVLKDSRFSLHTDKKSEDMTVLNDRLQALHWKNLKVATVVGSKKTTIYDATGLSWNDINIQGDWKQYVVGPNKGAWGITIRRGSKKVQNRFPILDYALEDSMNARRKKIGDILEGLRQLLEPMLSRPRMAQTRLPV